MSEEIVRGYVMKVFPDGNAQVRLVYKDGVKVSGVEYARRWITIKRDTHFTKVTMKGVVSFGEKSLAREIKKGDLILLVKCGKFFTAKKWSFAIPNQIQENKPHHVVRRFYTEKCDKQSAKGLAELEEEFYPT